MTVYIIEIIKLLWIVSAKHSHFLFFSYTHTQNEEQRVCIIKLKINSINENCVCHRFFFWLLGWLKLFFIIFISRSFFFLFRFQFTRINIGCSVLNLICYQHYNEFNTSFNMAMMTQSKIYLHFKMIAPV